MSNIVLMIDSKHFLFRINNDAPAVVVVNSHESAPHNYHLENQINMPAQQPNDVNFNNENMKYENNPYRGKNIYQNLNIGLNPNQDMNINNRFANNFNNQENVT
jgi:hypothetical protein